MRPSNKKETFWTFSVPLSRSHWWGLSKELHGTREGFHTAAECKTSVSSQGLPGELSLGENMSSSALSTSTALLSHFSHWPMASSAPGANLWLWGAIHTHGGFVSPGAQSESNMRVLLVCVLSWLQLCPTSGWLSLHKASPKKRGNSLSLGICASHHRDFCKPSHMIQRNKHLYLWWCDVSLMYI